MFYTSTDYIMAKCTKRERWIPSHNNKHGYHPIITNMAGLIGVKYGLVIRPTTRGPGVRGHSALRHSLTQSVHSETPLPCGQFSGDIPTLTVCKVVWPFGAPSDQNVHTGCKVHPSFPTLLWGYELYVTFLFINVAIYKLNIYIMLIRSSDDQRHQVT